MKFRIEVDENISENEIVLRCKNLDEDMLELQRQLSGITKASGALEVFNGEADYYLKFSEIIFLETDGGLVIVHTKDQIFHTKQKLYELEEMLPFYFFRVSKSTILNTREIRCIHKNITGSSEIEFSGSVKKSYVSRNYYKPLLEKMKQQ
ncbi:MAG: LytTR family transcriptional regulator [Lachnospiraceae bacterium]|nr:LytTR family transcriptional regulator [Lachnospiraceae bacterium]